MKKINAQRTHIFAVAVEKYQDEKIPSVVCAENDATEFANAWQALGVDPSDCVVLANSQATVTSTLSRLKKALKAVKPGDRVIFFYAGHGVAFSDISYITAHDTQSGDVEATSIPLSDVLNVLRDCKSRHVLLFLDLCHSGFPIAPEQRGITSTFSADELKQFCADSEFHVGFVSCKTDEFSFVSNTFKHGIWSYCVIQALKGDAAAALEKGAFITGASLQRFVQEEVPRVLKVTITGNDSQTPCMFGNSTKDCVVADLGEHLRQRNLAKETPENIIRDSTLLGEARGHVRKLGGYMKPSIPLSTHSQWEQRFVGNSGEIEVADQATEIFEKVRRSLGYKRKDLDFSKDGPSATIKTPAFDVNVTLFQHPSAADEYVLRTEVASFRCPEIITDASFLKIFTKYCDSIVIELASELNIEAKIDEIEDIGTLADGLDYDPECTEFTLRLPESGIVLHATASRMVFSLVGLGNLEALIHNTLNAVARLAGERVTLGLPDSSNH